MKILWLCNGVLPMAAESFNIKAGNGGGWLVGMSEDLKNIDGNHLNIAFMHNNIKEVKERQIDNITYYAIPKNEINPCVYDQNTESYLKEVINTVKPDVIHIFGTEYPHTLAMMNICPVENTVISIQGLVSIYSRHYEASLPSLLPRTFKNYLMRRLLNKQRREFEIRGKFEEQAIKKAKHVIGRTTWDYACIKQINNNVNYHFCNETLRGEFYNQKWDIKNCEKHSIFVSQAGYPIKGLHILLEAMPEILKRYPKTHLYIAGFDITNGEALADKLNISYGKYIKDLINTKGLRKHITFTGDLNEEQMCNQFLKANVFVSPSSIENSPNSLGEAMILGVPSVSSCVGGVQNLLNHQTEGFVYPFDEPYMLAHYVSSIFENDSLALTLSKKARKHALVTHNRENNIKTLIEIYRKIS
ncbi:glycosyltransferase family 4 protein [Pseudoneobacillus sp. C159]